MYAWKTVLRPTTRRNWRDPSLATHLAFRIQSVHNKYQETWGRLTRSVLCAPDANARDVDERFDDLLLDADFVIAEVFQLVPDMIMQGVGGKLYGGCCPQAREI